MTPTKKIDAALDAVLMAGGYLALEFAFDHRVDAMREAMRKIMSDSYIQGSNDAQDAMKGK